jgi:hypothetical protein
MAAASGEPLGSIEKQHDTVFHRKDLPRCGSCFLFGRDGADLGEATIGEPNGGCNEEDGCGAVLDSRQA